MDQIHFAFEPDPARARQLDREMHAQLAGSLRHLCEASEGIVPFDAAGMSRLIRDLEGSGRYLPLVFRDYYALASALFNEEHTRAAELFDRLAQAQPAPEGQRVEPLRDPGACEKSAVYREMMTGDASTDIDILPPSAEVAERFIDRFRRGMAMMDEAIPELADEVRAIVREVVGVVGDPKRKMQFDGGSHFQLWGALFLNADFHPTEQAIVEVVAHESAHSLLFGFCTKEPLVFNEDDELFASPLRQDRRPMDGIFHATFVSARMHWAMSRLIDSGLLSEQALEATIEARERDRCNFEAGHQVVAEHGRLSETGSKIMAGAREYMDAVAV